MGLLETMGPLELDEASDQEPIGPLEQAGALDQEPMGLLWRSWGPLRLHRWGPRSRANWAPLDVVVSLLETTGPSWIQLGLLEPARAID